MNFYGMIKYFTEEAIHNLWMNRVMNLLSLVTIGTSVFVLGIFLLVNVNLSSVIGEWTNSIRINIFLKDSIEAKDISSLKQAIKIRAEVEDYIFISKEEALDRFLKCFSNLEDVTASLDNNPLPASFELTMKPEYSSKTSVLSMVKRLSELEGIDEIQYDVKWIERLEALSRVLSIVGYIIFLILGVAALFTISNVIRLTVYSRSDEIEIMRLVGATNSFIRGPFIFEGGIQGGIGATMGIIALYVSYRFFLGYLAESSDFFLQFLTISFLSIKTCFSLIALGILAGVFASTLAVRKFINI